MDLATLGRAENIPKPVEKDNEISFSNEGSAFNAGILLCWVAAAIAMASCVFIFLIQSSSNQRLQTKRSELQDTLSAIHSTDLSEIEKKASSFKASVSQLITVDSTRYKMSKFLPLFYQKVNKNVRLTSITLGSKNALTIDGKTDSYKSVAEQSEILEAWAADGTNKILKNVQIVSTSLTSDSSGSGLVSFTISATINKAASLVQKSDNLTISPDDTSSSAESNLNSTLPESEEDDAPIE